MTSEPGASDDELVLGTHTSLTGPLAAATLEVLRRAGPHPTRAGVIAAAESLAGWRSPLALVPATCSASDHALFGDAALLVVRGGRWVPYGTDERASRCHCAAGSGSIARRIRGASEPEGWAAR